MVEERLAEARVAALYKSARSAYFATVANGALLLLVLWNEFPTALLLGWLGLVAVVTVARSGLQRAYARTPGGRDPRRWETRFAVGAISAGLLWTYPPAVFLPASDPLLQMAVVFVVGGSIIGAAGVYAASPAAF